MSALSALHSTAAKANRSWHSALVVDHQARCWRLCPGGRKIPLYLGIGANSCERLTVRSAAGTENEAFGFAKWLAKRRCLWNYLQFDFLHLRRDYEAPA